MPDSIARRISVLIPTRQRTEPLHENVARLLATADCPEEVELLIRADLDDPASVEAALGLDASNRHVVVGPRYDGWRSNHRFFNELARVASGEWLFLYNDDASMLTAGWDTLIHQAPPRRLLCPAMIWKGRSERPHRFEALGMLFENSEPILHRTLYEAMGHFALHCHADVYLEWLLRPIGLQVPVSIRILHAPTTSQDLRHTRPAAWRHDFQHDPWLRQQTAEARARILQGETRREKAEETFA